MKHVENVETASVEKQAVEIMLVRLLFHKAGCSANTKSGHFSSWKNVRFLQNVCTSQGFKL